MHALTHTTHARTRHCNFVFVCPTGNHWNALTDGVWKYIFNANSATEQLFHLAEDPHELVDLWSDPTCVSCECCSVRVWLMMMMMTNMWRPLFRCCVASCSDGLMSAADMSACAVVRLGGVVYVLVRVAIMHVACVQEMHDACHTLRCVRSSCARSVQVRTCTCTCPSSSSSP